MPQILSQWLENGHLAFSLSNPQPDPDKVFPEG